jgi:SAM-dependent methyltransferase
MVDWNERYRRGDFASLEINPLLVRAVEGLAPAEALDLACGAGRHALYLAARGWRVTAVDLSTVGIELLKSRTAELDLTVNTRIVDLECAEFKFVPESYELICDFYFLVREMFGGIRRSLKPGGTFVAAIRLADDGSDSSGHAYALGPGQLLEYFADWDIVYYHETSGVDMDGGQHHRRTAELIVRRPDGVGTSVDG